MTSFSEDRRSSQKLVEKVLRDPTLYPDEFLSWLPRWLQTNVNFQLATSQLPSVESWRLVGASGNAVFENSWVNYGGTNAAAAYYKDPFGRVHLKGLVKSGALNTTIFTLPTGYRPQEVEHFSVVANGAFGQVVVQPDGTVQQQVGSNGYVSLASISYRAFS